MKTLPGTHVHRCAGPCRGGKPDCSLRRAHHVLAPSETALHGEHCVLATDLMARRGVRECVSLDAGPHKTVVGYFHKHLK